MPNWEGFRVCQSTFSNPNLLRKSANARPGKGGLQRGFASGVKKHLLEPNHRAMSNFVTPKMSFQNLLDPTSRPHFQTPPAKVELARPHFRLAAYTWIRPVLRDTRRMDALVHEEDILLHSLDLIEDAHEEAPPPSDFSPSASSSSSIASKNKRRVSYSEPLFIILLLLLPPPRGGFTLCICNIPNGLTTPELSADQFP